MLNEGAVVEQFVAAMREQGIEVSAADVIGDGKFRRIHVIGDKRGARNGWYVLYIDERPAGKFGCNKRYGNEAQFNWKLSEKAVPLSAAERLALREAAQVRRAAKAAEDEARHAKAAELANSVWNSATEVEGSEHAYLARKSVQSHGLRTAAWEKLNKSTGKMSLIERDALLVPIRSAGKGKPIHSLQAIFPDADNPLGRDKDYLTDGDKHGRYFSIGKPVEVNGKPVILICEGYATGASLYEATGHAVIVAFDAGNLLPVAKVMRDMKPAATILLCADNDQWTTTPVNNPGVTKAREAAAAINGHVVFPPFTDADGHDEDGRRKGPTDFNDMAVLRGADAVSELINTVLLETVIDAEESEDVAPWEGESQPMTTGEKVIDDAMMRGDTEELVWNNRHFKILGYDREKYYIYAKELSQSRDLTPGRLTEVTLLQLAHQNFWELHFPAKTGFNKTAALNWLLRECAARGIYDSSRRRGRGAWLDDNRIVFHHGKTLSVDGVPAKFADINSRFVYEMDAALPDPADTMLSNEDGRRIIGLAKRFRWSMPASSALIAGFIMLAPLCGALRWRPHIWITGGAGCGKTTVLNDFAHFLMGGCDLYANGSSSEAGIRQKLEMDALPVLFDETESNEEGDARRIQNILSMIRQASTESDAKTYKGTAGGKSMSFHIRSMFCMASIQVAIKHQADIERLTVLGLRPKRDDEHAADNWIKLSGELAAIRADEDMPRRLLKRGLTLLPKIRQSIAVFAEVAARHFGSQREGDQYGTLLAGAWSLVNENVVTHEEAERLIKHYDWSEHRDTNDSDEASKALSALMESKLPHLGTMYSVYELVKEAADGVDGISIGQKAADSVLGRAGMRVRGTELLLSNQSQQLKRQVEDTPFAADLRGLLLRLPGANRNDQKPMRFSGVLSKCIAVPLGPILRDQESESDAAPEVAYI